MNEVFNKMIGQYILEKRLEKNISQVDLALHLGFSPQFMGRIEKGAVPIPDGALRKAIVLLDLEKRRVNKIVDYAGTWFVEELFQESYQKGAASIRGKR